MKKTKRVEINVKKLSILFDLPCWKVHIYILSLISFNWLVFHFTLGNVLICFYANVGTCITPQLSLDVMHVEKNVCESIIGTLLYIHGKSKDGYNARNDLQDMNIRHD